MRNLTLVLLDELDELPAAFAGFDPRSDAVWMAEQKKTPTQTKKRLRLEPQPPDRVLSLGDAPFSRSFSKEIYGVSAPNG